MLNRLYTFKTTYLASAISGVCYMISCNQLILNAATSCSKSHNQGLYKFHCVFIWSCTCIFVFNRNQRHKNKSIKIANRIYIKDLKENCV